MGHIQNIMIEMSRILRKMNWRSSKYNGRNELGNKKNGFRSLKYDRNDKGNKKMDGAV